MRDIFKENIQAEETIKREKKILAMQEIYE